MTITQKPRTIKVNDYFSVLAPNCPECRRNDKIRAEDVGDSWHFVCDRCKRMLTYEEAIDGQREVEQ